MHRKLGLVFCNDLEEQDGEWDGERDAGLKVVGDTCIHVADLLPGTAERHNTIKQ